MAVSWTAGFLAKAKSVLPKAYALKSACKSELPLQETHQQYALTAFNASARKTDHRNESCDWQ